MTHNEAVEELKKLAGPVAWALMYEVASYHGVQIHGYIKDAPPFGHAETSHTYAGAIENVKRMLSMIPAEPPPEDKDGENELPRS